MAEQRKPTQITSVDAAKASESATSKAGDFKIEPSRPFPEEVFYQLQNGNVLLLKIEHH